MFRHSLVPLGVALVLALAGCGGSERSESGNAEDAVSAAAPAEDQAAVLVTKDCGKGVVLAKTEVEAGQTAMQALDRVADIETASGGKFVSEIEDVAQDNAKKLAWLYYVNGEAAQKGATEIELAPGDVEWWDLHNYEQECATVPAEAR